MRQRTGASWPLRLLSNTLTVAELIFKNFNKLCVERFPHSLLKEQNA
jgi:hypothetical protein